MSDTPRTDTEAFVETNQANALVMASFARELERENNQLRAQLVEANRALELAVQCAQWHLGDGDECGEVARKAVDAINVARSATP